MPQKHSPRISVIMPVYNAARYLAEAVESVLSQSFQDFELIAVDDGSEDDSRDLLTPYAEQDPRIRVHRVDHGGVSRARNTAIEHAKGQFLANLDSDDVALPKRFEKQIAYLDSNPTCVAVGTGILMVDPDGDPISPHPFQETHEEIEAEVLRGRGLALTHSSCMFRRVAVQAVGGYDSTYRICEDIELYLRLAEIGRLANIPDTLLHVRRHIDSTSSQQTQQAMYEVRNQVVEAARRRRGQPIPEEPEVPFFTQPSSTRALYASWIRLAVKAGYHSTARKYLFRLLTEDRLSADSRRELRNILAWYSRRITRRSRRHLGRLVGGMRSQRRDDSTKTP